MQKKEKEMRRRKSGKSLESRTSIHSKLSYFLGALAIIVQFYLGFSHINDADAAGQFFGTMSILEGIFAALGLILPDIIRGRGVRIYPRDYEWKRITFQTVVVMTIAFGANIMLQFAIKIPLTIRDVEMALAIVFAAPAEELFFRALMMESFITASDKTGWNKIKVTSKKTIGHLTMIGIIFSSIMFAMLHVNYYNDIRLMAIVLIGGMIYAIVYWWFRDITGCILAHFLLNLFAVGQMFFMFSL